MSSRYYVETSSSGRPQFVLKRSRSSHTHGHHHHHHHHTHRHHETAENHHRHHHTGYRVSYEEWKSLIEREQTLQESNRALCAENNALRTTLSAAEAENHRLTTVVVPQLQAQVASLEADNKSLRRSVDNAGGRHAKHHQELDRLTDKIARLEAEYHQAKEENEDLKERVKGLSKQLDGNLNRRVADLNREIEHWHDYARRQKARYHEISHRYEKMLDAFERQMRQIKRYEDMFRTRERVF
jgi:chromosome segregation ATPase